MTHTYQPHGLTLGLHQEQDQWLFELTAKGTLTHEDYQYFTPLLNFAFERSHDDHALFLVDISELRGWTLQAAWDDYQIGQKHGKQFQKIALVGHHQWQTLAAKVSQWFTAGEVKSFTDRAQAREWLLGTEASNS
ncbi:hypothetical protein VST7929_01890 [Vibrio stylophorae]|uniref:STAS/SEC14 domain-containing protein n=1 Tax=Vibrio stylophorae TaxID=659351 RepID=A0ABM8ZUK6_9VIBR|nr:STAS/SEC14 domain-containing protein [Vibrio stylophorae]CAH0534008.1 hypothetical protein VST7929_01890 [Vibrio stylophorae]